MRYKVNNFSNFAEILLHFAGSILSQKDIKKNTFIIYGIALFTDLFRFLSPESFNHLFIRFPIVVVITISLFAGVGLLLLSFLFKYFLERSLYISLEDKIMIWKASTIHKTIRYNDIESLEISHKDIFIHYRESNKEKLIALLNPDKSLKESLDSKLGPKWRVN